MPQKNAASDAKTEASPSSERRKKLRDADAGNISMSIIPSYPLEKYFAICDRLLESFQQALDERRLDETYIYGIRFCTFSVEALPKHPGYRRSLHKQRQRNAQQVDKVLKTMEIVTQRMDVEETIRRQQEQERLEEERQRQEEERIRAEQEAEKLKAGQTEEMRQQEQRNLEQSAYAKLQAMKDQMMAASKKKDASPSESVAAPQKTPSSTDAKAKSTKTPKKTKQPTASKTEATKTPVKNNRQSPAPKQKKTISTPAQVAPTPTPTTPAPKPTTTTKNSSTSVVTKPSPRRREPTTAEEIAIQKLEQTIRLQEARLAQIDQVQIPTLLQQAKQHLQDGNRKAALSCVRKKRRLEYMMDVSKGAIFQLETQIFQIENAIEDKMVHEALQAAASAMDGLQKSVGGIDADALQEGLASASAAASAELDVGDVVDEEELMQELVQWTTPQKKKRVDIDDDDNISILSLPTLPSTSLEDDDVSASSSVRGLLKAVLG